MTLNDRLLKVQLNIEKALLRSGRTQSVKIVAATKTRDPNTINKTLRAGVVNIGENRIREAEKKFNKVLKTKGVKKRFIGHLQSNKVNKCLDLFDTIDSIHSFKIAKKISKRLNITNKKIECLIEVNTSGDKNKKGFSPNSLSEMVECVKVENLNIKGLMTLGPQSQNPQKTRETFISLRNLLNDINKQTPNNRLSELSMGMSGDYIIAVEEGSTMVRLGTALYGPRTQL